MRLFAINLIVSIIIHIIFASISLIFKYSIGHDTLLIYFFSTTLNPIIITKLDLKYSLKNNITNIPFKTVIIPVLVSIIIHFSIRYYFILEYDKIGYLVSYIFFTIFSFCELLFIVGLNFKNNKLLKYKNAKGRFI